MDHKENIVLKSLSGGAALPHGLLTLVLRVPGQPFALGAVGGADDADSVSALHLQVVFAQFAGQQHTSMIHGLLLSGDLLGQRENREQHNNMLCAQTKEYNLSQFHHVLSFIV